jgi:hypothetical protein
MTMKRLRTYLLFGTKAAISLALLSVALHFVNFAILRERFYRLDYAWVAAALIALACQVVLVSLRWELIAHTCGARLTLRQAVLYNFIGSFFSQVLPSTIGGDAARIWLLARNTGAWKSAIFSVLVDRIAGLVWLAVLVLVSLPWSLALIQNSTARAALIVIGAAGAAAPCGLFLLSQLGRTPLGQWKAMRHLTNIATIAWTVLGSLRTGAPVAALSVTVHLITVLVLWFCARAIGSPFTLVNSVLLIPPVILIAAVPISIGGWGVRESVMLAAFAYAGLPNGDGLLVSILFGICSFVIGAFGGIAWSLSANRVGFAAVREAGDQALEV